MQTHSLTANKIFIKLQQILPIITHKSVRLLHAAPYVDNEISILFWLNEERKTTTKIKCVQTFQQVFFSNNIFADLKAILLNCKPHDVFYLAINGCYMYGDVQSSQVVMVCSSRERERLHGRATSACRLSVSDANQLDIQPFPMIYRSVFFSINIKYSECKSFSLNISKNLLELKL